MGAQQSSGRDQSESSSETVKTCYYELLGVGRDASDDEYALVLHFAMLWGLCLGLC